MTKLALRDENIHHLAEEIKAIVVNAYGETTRIMLVTKYMVGESIATSPLFKKNGKSQSMLYEAIALEAKLRPSTLSDCVKLWEKYPGKEPKMLADTLYTEYGAWRNVRLALYGGVVPNAYETTERPECSHKCPRHCKQ